MPKTPTPSPAEPALRILSVRDRFGEKACLSRVYIDGVYFSHLCEDEDRGLNASDTLAHIKTLKVQGETAIPCGTYDLELYDSPKHGKDTIQFVDVPGFQNIQCHSGNKESQTLGCPMPGFEQGPDLTVLRSRDAVAALRAKVVPLLQAGERVTWTVARVGEV